MRLTRSTHHEGERVQCARHVWTVVLVGMEPVGVTCSVCDQSRSVGMPEPSNPEIQLEPGLEYRLRHADSTWIARVEHMRISSRAGETTIDVEFSTEPRF